MTTALNRLRLARGQSLRQLAADVGCSYETIRRLERGHTTEAFPSTRVALERVLGVPYEVLIAPLNDNGDARQNVAVTAVTTAKSPSEDS